MPARQTNGQQVEVLQWQMDWLEEAHRRLQLARAGALERPLPSAFVTFKCASLSHSGRIAGVWGWFWSSTSARSPLTTKRSFQPTPTPTNPNPNPNPNLKPNPNQPQPQPQSTPPQLPLARSGRRHLPAHTRRAVLAAAAGAKPR